MNNKYFKHFFIVFIFLFTTISNVSAHGSPNKVTITDGYIKASIPGSDITASYMTINNDSDKVITLQKVTSSISDRIEIHEHTMVNDMMRMRQVDNITIDANSHVLLQPSGLHLMIFSLKQQLKESSTVTFTLHFSNDTKINIQLPVYRYK